MRPLILITNDDGIFSPGLLAIDEAVAVSRALPLSLLHAKDYPEVSWEVCRKITRDTAEKIIKNGLPADVSIININVPETADDQTDIIWTRQSRLNSAIFVKPPRRDFHAGYQLASKPYPQIADAEKDSDVYALFVLRAISITPVTWDLSVKTDCKS